MTGSPTVRPAEKIEISRVGELNLFTCVFVALNGGGITVQLDDFSDQLVPTDFNL